MPAADLGACCKLSLSAQRYRLSTRVPRFSRESKLVDCGGVPRPRGERRSSQQACFPEKMRNVHRSEKTMAASHNESVSPQTECYKHFQVRGKRGKAGLLACRGPPRPCGERRGRPTNPLSRATRRSRNAPTESLQWEKFFGRGNISLWAQCCCTIRDTAPVGARASGTAHLLLANLVIF